MKMFDLFIRFRLESLRLQTLELKTSEAERPKETTRIFFRNGNKVSALYDRKTERDGESSMSAE